MVMYSSIQAQMGQSHLGIWCSKTNLEISTKLPKEALIYGLGENTRPSGIKLQPNDPYTLYTTDVSAINLNNDPYTLYTTDVFDFYFFSGPTLLSVVDQYTQFVGRPAPMPYWALEIATRKYDTLIGEGGFGSIYRGTLPDGQEVAVKYAKFVKPAFDDFVLPSKKYADVIIPRGGDNHVAIDLIVQHLRTKLGLHDLCKIYPNVNVIQSTFQIRGMHTLIRDREISKHDFVFYSDRLIRLVVEHGLGHLPFTEKQVVTPTGIFLLTLVVPGNRNFNTAMRMPKFRPQFISLENETSNKFTSLEALKCVGGPIARRISYLKALQDNMEILKRKRDELEAKESDINTKLQIAEEQSNQTKPLEEVTLWMKNVERAKIKFLKLVLPTLSSTVSLMQVNGLGLTFIASFLMKSFSVLQHFHSRIIVALKGICYVGLSQNPDYLLPPLLRSKVLSPTAGVMKEPWYVAVWKCKVPEKVRMFLWLACQDAHY
ncbi:hypothetical protein Sjap_002331 [Stephania japonica]|uniref:Phosphoribosyltransferase domain-containing protein n=1 Tax=Stephania japonica TaxID=461633 RepID=A0AAP0KLN7_9MAGN